MRKAPTSDPSMPACGAGDESWETAIVMARSCVRDYIWDKCGNAQERAQVQEQICTALEIYVRSLIRVKKRKANGRSVYQREFLAEPLGAVEPLRRLLTSHTAHARARAWTELPSVALDALNDAAHQLRGVPLRAIMRQWMTLPGTFVQFDAGEISELVPVAIQIARNYGNRNVIRDKTAETLLRQFTLMHGRLPSEKEADRFFSSIETCYAELLPKNGLNIRSPSTLYRTLSHSKRQVSN